MINEILAIPNPLAVASGVEGSLELGGSITYPPLPQGGHPELFVIDPSIQWTADNRLIKVSGAPNTGGQATGTLLTPSQQPLWVNGAYGPIRPFHQGAHIGILDHLNRFYGWFAFSNANDGGGWHYNGSIKGIQVTPGGPGGQATPAFTNMAVQTDATGISLMRLHQGIWRVEYRWTKDEEILTWKPYYVLWDPGTELWNLQQRVDEAVIPITVHNTQVEQIPAGFAVIRNIDVNHLGLIATSVGNKTLRLSNPEIDTHLDVAVVVSALYLQPVPATAIAIQGQVIQFQSNGGLGGIFEVSGGTILSGLRWQAPFSIGRVDFTYTINNVTANASLEVVKKLEVSGVDEDGFYPDMAQGERVQFVATCPGARFRSITHPFSVNVRGSLVAPHDINDPVFGEKTITILVNGCGQVYSFKIKIQPMFPTPDFCGPVPLKWKKNDPDFLPNTSIMSGGTSQVKNRNREGIIIWEVEYNPLIEKINEGCTCDSVLPTGHLPGCDSKLATASRLSDFYKLVSTARYFSLKDYETGVLYKYVRLTQWSRDHVIFDTGQSRRLTMRYEGIPLTAVVLQPTTDAEAHHGDELGTPPLEATYPSRTLLLGGEPILLGDKPVYLPPA